MRSTLKLLLAFTLLCQQSVVGSSDPFQLTWQQSGRSTIIKLDTPQYPLWSMDKAKAPMYYEDAGDFYTPVDVPSAVLLNLTLSYDNRTLLLNHQPILPLSDVNIPPRIGAYQVPANTTEKQLRNIISYGVLDRKWEGITLGWRYVNLDYDRLVWRDPQARNWMNNSPILYFRLIGIGAHERNDHLNAIYQPVLRVKLQDTNGAWSDSPLLSYNIADVSLFDVNAAYGSMPIEEHVDECISRSWRCPDRGVNNAWMNGMELDEVGSPYYRYIWRSRFDEFGRVGSMRHAVVEKMHVVSDLFGDASPTMAFSFAILCALAMGIHGLVLIARHYTTWRIHRNREMAVEERLLGEKATSRGEFQERYVDEQEEDERPPLKDMIVTMQQEGSLI